MNGFWSGFEKRAYDYKQEAKELNEEYGARSKETPADKSKSALIGAGIGAGLGGFIGLGAGGPGVLTGMGMGGLFGGLMGLFSAISHKLGIEEAKRIMKMTPKARDEYLKSLARKNEISEAEHREWQREFRRESREDTRHQETLRALRNRY